MERYAEACGKIDGTIESKEDTSSARGDITCAKNDIRCIVAKLTAMKPDKLQMLISDEATTLWENCIAVSSIYLETEEIGAAKGNFKEASRVEGDIDAIVIHHCGGNAAGCIRELTTGSRQVSAHFVVDKKGKVTKIVNTEDVAYHAKGYNSKTIGIETEGSGGSDLTPAMYLSLAKLVNELSDNYNIPKTHPIEDFYSPPASGIRGVVSHQQFAYTKWRKTDPAGFDWDNFMTLVNGEMVTIAGATLNINMESVA